MKDRLVAQCVMESGNHLKEGWLDASKIKVGYSVTLKNSDEPDRWWKIIAMSTPVNAKSIKTEHDSSAIFEKDFHGRLGGLKLS